MSAADESSRIAREVLAAEAEQLGRRPRVSEPLDMVINGLEFKVTPCSGKHRAWNLTGFVVLSCGKCKAEQVSA